MKLMEYLLRLDCRFDFRHIAGKVTGMKWFFIVHLKIVNYLLVESYQRFMDGL